MSLVIIGGRIVDPSQGLDRVASLHLADGRVVGFDLPVASGDSVVDARDKIVVPGLIDMHVHLRDPGFEEDETIETGTLAAVRGGFTTIACCPNTQPPLDTQATVELVRQKAAKAARCNVKVICAISRGREGKELAELGQLFEAGAVACSDDGAPVSDAELMRRAFEYCLMFDKPVLSHAEDTSLTQGGVMHEGAVSLALGLRGIPAAAEDVMVARDITLAELTGGRLHVMHASTDGAIQAIRRAKLRGVRVTAEVTPHHLTLTDEELRTFSTNVKMSPPLRGRQHVEACIEGLRDGTIDAIASDHAPHAAEKKMRELDKAPFGVIGLETSLAVVVTNLVATKIIDWATLVQKMSTNPATILGLTSKGTLRIGGDADVTIIDPHRRWHVTPNELASKSHNSAFLGHELTGRATATIVGGKVVFAE
ncbi:MAG: dihydroorotase [Thermoguttaceae bacterium]